MKNIIITLFLILSHNIIGQTIDGILFKKFTNDFGDIKEEKEEAKCIFSFKNIGKMPISILKVETSCGCTTPDYTKTEILPGDTGFVKAIYGTRGRPGGFNKYMYVYFKEKSNYITLTIKGNVLPQANYAKKPVQYTTTYSNLAFTETIASFNSIKKSEKLETKIKAYNYNGYPIKIKEVALIPEYVTLDLQDSLLRVDDSLIITVKVDGSKIPAYGEKFAQIALLTDDVGMEKKFIYVHTIHKEDFSKLTKQQLANAPKMIFDRKMPIDFGKKTAGAKVKQVIKITNDGKSDLVIKQLIPSCSCITFNIGKQSLKPGESVELIIQIDTVNQTIAQHTKYLTILTNDPLQPEFNLKMSIDITQ
jgi:hypothetical protein